MTTASSAEELRMHTQLFQRIDQDGDGQLTVEERAGAFHIR